MPVVRDGGKNMIEFVMVASFLVWAAFLTGFAFGFAAAAYKRRRHG